MRALSRRPAAVAAAVLASLALGAGCGGSDESSDPTVPAAREPDPCDLRPPGRVADGVNDDQGGSNPGTDPCADP